MGAQGTTTVDFGAFPGKTEATVAVTGQGAIIAGSLAEAWLWPVATADHSIDEHYAEAENFIVWAQSVVAGNGFTIYVRCAPAVREPLSFPGVNANQNNSSSTALSNQNQQPTSVPSIGGQAPRVYGLWTVAWVWN